MEHRTIDAENVAERYVTGRLSPADAAVFEEHFLDCPECCARVEAAQRLERGMRRLAEEAAVEPQTASRASRWSRWSRWSRSPLPALAAAALLAVALLPAWQGVREVRHLRRELSTTREALARAEAERASPERPAAVEALETELQDARRGLAAEAEKREALARELAAGRQPQVNVPVLPLTSVRSGADGPVRTLALPREPGWVALWLEPDDTGWPAYRATLRDARGAEVFQAGGLELNDLGALLVTVHSTSLVPGDYRLEVDGVPRAGAPVSAGRFTVRVSPQG